MHFSSQRILFQLHIHSRHLEFNWKFSKLLVLVAYLIVTLMKASKDHDWVDLFLSRVRLKERLDTDRLFQDVDMLFCNYRNSSNWFRRCSLGPNIILRVTGFIFDNKNLPYLVTSFLTSAKLFGIFTPILIHWSLHSLTIWFLHQKGEKNEEKTDQDEFVLVQFNSKTWSWNLLLTILSLNFSNK